LGLEKEIRIKPADLEEGEKIRAQIETPTGIVVLD
jgi:hypothetical protein